MPFTINRSWLVVAGLIERVGVTRATVGRFGDCCQPHATGQKTGGGTVAAVLDLGRQPDRSQCGPGRTGIPGIGTFPVTPPAAPSRCGAMGDGPGTPRQPWTITPGYLIPLRAHLRHRNANPIG